MSEVKEVRIPIREFGVRHFVEWLQSSASSGVIAQSNAEKILSSLCSKPYCSVIVRHRSEFHAFVMQTIGKKINLSENDIFRVYFKDTKRKSKKFESVDAAIEELVCNLRQEFGVTGLAPRPLTTAINNQIISCIDRMNRYLTVHPNRLPITSAIKDACLMCRGFENLTNVYFEFKFYIVEESIEENDRDAILNAKWQEKIDFLSEKSRTTNGILEQLFQNDTVDKLHQIRKIRNKIAHPKDVTYGDLATLVRISEELFSMLRSRMPLIACISSVRLDLRGTEVGIYSEADTRVAKPTLIQGTELGFDVKKDSVYTEVILYPFFLDNKKQYRLAIEHAILYERKAEVLNKIYQKDIAEPGLIVEYQETSRKYEISEEVEIADE